MQPMSDKGGTHNEEGYEMKFDGTCKDCAQFNAWGLVVSVYIFFVIVYLAMNISSTTATTITALLEALAELKPIAKMVIATMQIITGFRLHEIPHGHTKSRRQPRE